MMVTLNFMAVLAVILMVSILWTNLRGAPWLPTSVGKVHNSVISFILALRIHEGKQKVKRSALVDSGCHVYCSMVTLSYSIYGSKPHAGPFSSLLSGVEGFENSF